MADTGAFEFAKKIINDPQCIPYEKIRKTEEDNAKLVKTKLTGDAEKADIDYILTKLKIS